MLISALLATFIYFVPPQGWQCVPAKSSPHVQVGFVTQGKKGFNPSINFATEDEVDVSLKEYIQAVKEIHLSQPNTQWRDLGPFSMKGGLGRLVEISDPSPWGPSQKLQAILIHDKTAYILTAATLKEEFSIYRKEILQSLKSLAFAKDAFTCLENAATRQIFEQFFASLGVFSPEKDRAVEQKNQWEALQQLAAEHSEALGTHWQFLVLKEGYAKIHSP